MDTAYPPLGDLSETFCVLRDTLLSTNKIKAGPLNIALNLELTEFGGSNLGLSNSQRYQ